MYPQIEDKDIPADGHGIDTETETEVEVEIEVRDEEQENFRPEVGDYSDQHNIDVECEDLLKNTKKQVKQMMEEAVTKKFIHEESSSIISLCVAVDACLSHGLKRRALGLFKTNSSIALIQKLSKDCVSAREVLTAVDEQERRIQSENKSRMNQHDSGSQKQSTLTIKLSAPLTNSSIIQRRHLWIKIALIDKKLVHIVEYLADNCLKYYEPDALMSNHLCAQILCSLLMGPSALEFSRTKISEFYQLKDPTAEDLVKRHKLANPIACLCHHKGYHQSEESSTPKISEHTKLSRSITDNYAGSKSLKPTRYVTPDSDCIKISGDDPIAKKDGSQNRAVSMDQSRGNRSPSPCRSIGRKETNSRRKPLALKAGTKRGTLITDCHHYSCQERSEHQTTKGYSFLCSSSSLVNQSPIVSQASSENGSTISSMNARGRVGQVNSQQNFHHPSEWSPRMLHETLHQNSSSLLLYAKNNVLLEVKPQETIAGYLSLHQSNNSDLILKWIPNQMINGSTQSVCTNGTSKLVSMQQDRDANQPKSAVESSYLDLVISLSVSRIVLLHCRFSKALNTDATMIHNPEDHLSPEQSTDKSDDQLETTTPNSLPTEETLILVEADGVLREPFKFPIGGLKQFLECLESGLRPERYLEPAVKLDSRTPDPLNSPKDNNTNESATPNNELPESRLNLILKRLPSLKRKSGTKKEPIDSPEANISNSDIKFDDQEQWPPTDNFVYRIVSSQQPEWPLQTPLHSALSVGSSSSGSTQLNNGKNQTPLSATGSIRFRWTLGKLANLSSRYTTSVGSNTSSSTRGFFNTLNGDSLGSMGSFSGSINQATENGSISKTYDDDSPHERNGFSNTDQNNSRFKSGDLARIVAKLDDLRQSTSGDLSALRTQSIQSLCESMRRQIVARAFYGWLVYCRRLKIIRKHLMKLIKQDDLLVDEDRIETYYGDGLTRHRWKELVVNRNSDPSEISSDIEQRLRVEINRLVFYGGIESNELRREVWPYLLGHYKYTDNEKKRSEGDKLAQELYRSCGSEWIVIEKVVKQRDHEILAANMAKASREMARADQKLHNQAGGLVQESSSPKDDKIIESDCIQSEEGEILDDNDEIVEIESNNQGSGGQIDSLTGDSECGDKPSKLKANRFRKSNDKSEVSTKRRRQRARLESTGSVGSDASITDQFGNNIHRIDKDVQRCDRSYWYFKDNNNLEKLRNIMCTYVWQHLDVGYVQGMCDLAAPFLVIFDDELMAYNCFSQLMKRMESNFPHGCAMDQHFESLKHLMQILDPKLFDVLQSNGDYTHFYFCYRWLLLDFKRELAYEDVYRVWETIWSARVICSDHFVIFMALAMVRYYRDIIIENNMDFTDTIKFFNEMAERHDAQGITSLARDCITELIDMIKD